MFRRKEEGAGDMGVEAMASLNLTQEDGASAQGGSPRAANPAAEQNPVYARNTVESSPSAQPLPNLQPLNAQGNPQPNPLTRQASEAPRAPAPAGAAYRPTPVSDFNRSALSRPAAESRPATTAPAAPFPASAAPSEKAADVKRSPRILTVGNDILLKGEIETCDRVIIEGRVEAKLSDVHTLAIAGCGSFKGTAEVEQAELTGLFEGDLIVKGRLVIYATGEVRGNITYGEIEIERGGRLTGQIKTVADSVKEKPKPTLLDSLEKPLRQKEAV